MNSTLDGIASCVPVGGTAGRDLPADGTHDEQPAIASEPYRQSRQDSPRRNVSIGTYADASLGGSAISCWRLRWIGPF